MIFGGIDPGVTGAIVLMGDNWIASHDCPVLGSSIDFYRVTKIFRGILEAVPKQMIRIGLEKAQAMPKQGVVSMFHYGVGYGGYIGALAALEIPFEEITPFKWKKYFGLCKKTKFDSVLLAKKMFPSVELSRKKDHGKAEALLIAEFVRRRLEGEKDGSLYPKHLRSPISEVRNEIQPTMAADQGADLSGKWF
jgi:crossover junction endodeoxyribonuclease RuvC